MCLQLDGLFIYKHRNITGWIEGGSFTIYYFYIVITTFFLQPKHIFTTPSPNLI